MGTLRRWTRGRWLRLLFPGTTPREAAYDRWWRGVLADLEGP